MLSKSSVDKSFIKEDKKSFSYSRSAEAKIGTSSEQVAAGAGDATAKLPYNASLAKNPKDGVTFSDNKGERSVIMTARYPQSAGRYQDGRVIYPTNGDEVSSYTFKRNGLKQDILLSKPTKKTLSFSWDLKLADSLEARLLPNGGVGIYSARSDLFGNITVSDDKSQKLIDNARKVGAKDNLLYILPQPYMTDSRGVVNYEDLNYKLEKGVLTLEVRNLLSQKYPLSIDPTIIVTATSDFRQGIGDISNTSFATTDQITRGGVSNGALDAWTQDTGGDFTTARYGHTAVAYNGNLYVVGGRQAATNTDCNSVVSAYCNDIWYAPINSGGDVGTWVHNPYSFTNGRYMHTSVVYNGYLYVVGGFDGVTYYNDVQYAPINSGGDVGTFTTDTGGNFSNVRYGHTSVAYNGYLYVIGGFDGVTYYNDVQYAPINSGGDVGTWQTTTAGFVSGRYMHTSVAYNGYLYVIGGFDGGYSSYVQFASINSTGNITAWTYTSNEISTFTGQTVAVYNGNLYLFGGYNGCCYFSNVQFASINSDGTLGKWWSTTALTTARSQHASVAYNGYLYVVGGNNSGVYKNDTWYTSLKDGNTSSWGLTGVFFPARAFNASVAYNGYLYVLGGCTDYSSCTTRSSLTQYAKINLDGTLGNFFTTTATFSVARSNLSAAAYNGYMYITGGFGSGYRSDVQYGPISANGNIASWTTTSAFSIARSDHATVAYRDYLYIFGGIHSLSDQLCGGNAFYGNTIYCADYQYARINTDGTVGAWISSSAVAIGTPRSGLGASVKDGFMYTYGGLTESIGFANSCSGSGTTAVCGDLKSYTVNSDGSLTAAGNMTLATQKSFFGSAISNGYLYVFGGLDSNGSNNDTSHYALICTGSNNGVSGCGATAGRVGTWYTAPTLPTPQTYGAAASYNGYLYFMGGQTTTSYQLQGYVAKVDINAGAKTAVYDNSADLTIGRQFSASVAYNGYLYTLGGVHTTSDTLCAPVVTFRCNDVWYAPISSDGTVGAFVIDPGTSFTNAREKLQAFVYNGYIYIVGGYDGTTIYSDTQSAYICDGTTTGGCTAGSGHIGEIGTWSATASMNISRYSHALTVYNGFVYVIGGWSSTGETYTTEFAKINSNGTLGSWSYTASPPSSNRMYASAAAYNGYIYFIGGYSGITGISVSTIQFASINANGRINNDWSETTSMPTTRYAHGSVVKNGFLYIYGSRSEIIIARLKADGTIDSLVSEQSGLLDYHSYAGFAVYNDYAYLTGGGSYLATTEHIGLMASAQKSHYEKIFDTGSSGNIINSFIINGTTNCSYTVDYKTAGSTGIYGGTTTIQNVLPSVSQTITTANARYILLGVTIDDSLCGGISTITDIRLTYNAAPDAPTLFLPANNATNVAILPEFRVGTSDDSNDYIRYKIELYGTSSCTSPLVRTIDQTSSQTGWKSGAAQSGTAYLGGATITQLGIHAYQPSALSPSTQYWWRAYAIDPGGTNQWSAASSCYSFTTGIAVPNQQVIRGNTIIKGNTVIH